MAALELCGYMPGADGRVTELHAVYYSRHWGFGLFFEAEAAKEMSEFLSRYDQARDRFWTGVHEDRTGPAKDKMVSGQKVPLNEEEIFYYLHRGQA